MVVNVAGLGIPYKVNTWVYHQNKGMAMKMVLSRRESCLVFKRENWAQQPEPVTGLQGESHFKVLISKSYFKSDNEDAMFLLLMVYL